MFNLPRPNQLGETLHEPPRRAARGTRGFPRRVTASTALRLSPFTRDRREAERGSRAGGALDGVVAKRLDVPYAASGPC